MAYSYIKLGDGFSKTGSKASYAIDGNFGIIQNGSQVEYKQQVRYVYALYFHYRVPKKPPQSVYYKPPVTNKPGKRIVTHVNLGGPDIMVPVDQVRLLQL